jgi:hypothetical protein
MNSGDFMKNLLITGILSLALLSCGLFGGNRFSGEIVKETRKVENVSKVSVGYGFDVTMAVGGEESLVIEAPEDAMPYIITTVENHELLVKLDPDVKPSQLSVKKISLVVKSIGGIRISGTSTLHCDDVISADTVSIGTSGKSQANLFVHSNETQIESSGTSKVIIAGQTVSLDVLGISGESLFDGFSFTVNKTSVFASGKSVVKTHTTEELDVSASGASRILYKGHPDIETHLSGDAKVEDYN